MECSPFFDRQLIQRLVTSNPSPAYVGRGAAAVANNGSGGCGNMQAVIHAVLLDREALAPAGSSLRTGKLREPLVRLGNWMRAFDAKDTVLQHRIDSLSDPLSGLGLNIGSGYLFGTTQGETALRDIISTAGDDMMHEEHVATFSAPFPARTC